MMATRHGVNMLRLLVCEAEMETPLLKADWRQRQ